MSAFKPSPYQQAIFDYIAKKSGSLIIEAVAGSGKTTTIKESIRYIPEDKSILFCAFNKSIANELEEKLPDTVTVKTLNGLGHAAWRRHIGTNPQVNTNKTYEILTSEEHFKACGLPESRWAKLRGKARRLTNIAKQNGIVPDGVEDATGLTPDTLETWDLLIEHHDIEFGDEDERMGLSQEQIKKNDLADKQDSILMARECLRIGLQQWNEIDFDDQLYMTAVFGARTPAFDVVYVDEAQDISMIQRVLLKRAVKKGGRLIAVGDPHQAIYGFRGADSKSLQRIKEEFDAVSFPLSISYRCPKAVVREAQKYVRHIQPSDTAPEGVVTNLGEYHPRRMDLFQPGDFVICRNTAPLVRLALTLIRNRKPAKITGNEIGQGLISLIKKLRPRTVEQLSEKLDAWREKEIEKILKKDPEGNTQRIEEKHGCISAFIEMTSTNSVPELLQTIEELFNNEDDARIVRLSTIHKAKGLEADRVLILDSWLMPSKHAKKDWQLEQENNLSYVAVTRSKRALGYVQSPPKGGGGRRHLGPSLETPRDEHGRAHGTVIGPGSGVTVYTHGVLSHLDDGKGNIYEEGDDHGEK